MKYPKRPLIPQKNKELFRTHTISGKILRKENCRLLKSLGEMI